MKLLDSDGKADEIRRAGCAHPDHTTLIETGTGWGDLPIRLLDDFERIITIEAHPGRAMASKRRLHGFDNVQVVKGSSVARLAKAIRGPSLLFLDAHEDVVDGWGVLAAELQILGASPWRHVILIDDARLCNGRKGWPTIGEIEEWAVRNDYRYTLVGDIIWLEP